MYVAWEEDIGREFLIKPYLNYDISNKNSFFLPSKSKWLMQEIMRKMINN